MQGPLILDRYRPIEVKGEGATGIVELCWDTRIRRRVAIKRMPLSNARSDNNVPGLYEARTSAMLSRPSIVTVYDFDADNEEAYLIMEAIEGPALSELIHDTPAGTFDPDIAAAILTAVGDALQYAHDNQVLHLDIKPDNILITRSGACKVSDFGVAQLASAQGFGKATGGTIGYMPPEQMSRKELDERSDVFALAAVAYEILTGRRPFEARSLNESKKRIEKFDIAPPSTVRGDLDPGIDTVFFTALAPNREERYPTVQAFLDALLPYLGNALKGSQRLHEIVAIEDDEEEAAFDKGARAGKLKAVSPRLSLVLGRFVAAALCWWVSTAALVDIPSLSLETAMLIALLSALAGAVKPTFGTFITICMNGVALILGAPPNIVLGIISIIIAIAWVILFVRSGTAQANCALCISPLGLAGFSPVAPMLAGYFLTPLNTVGAVAIQVLLMLSIGQIAGPELLFGNIVSLSSWIIIGGWFAAAVLMSLFCMREARILSIIGTILASCVLLVTQSIAAWSITGIFAAPSSTWTIATVVSCVVMCIVSIIEVPLREEGE